MSTLGARDFSSTVSGFCQVFIVTLRPTPKIPAAREKNLWYPGQEMSYWEFFLLKVAYFVAMIKFSWRGKANSKGVHILRGCIFKVMMVN